MQLPLLLAFLLSTLLCSLSAPVPGAPGSAHGKGSSSQSPHYRVTSGPVSQDSITLVQSITGQQKDSAIVRSVSATMSSKQFPWQIPQSHTMVNLKWTQLAEWWADDHDQRIPHHILEQKVGRAVAEIVNDPKLKAENPEVLGFQVMLSATSTPFYTLIGNKVKSAVASAAQAIASQNSSPQTRFPAGTSGKQPFSNGHIIGGSQKHGAY